MDKGEYITNLFDAIKDEIEYDSDIEALYTLLMSMFKIDQKKSIAMWEYLITNTNLTSLRKDVNLTPILNSYPTYLIQELGFKSFYEILNKFTSTDKKYISENIFNIYAPESGINQLIEKLIIKDDSKTEKEIIHLILKESKIYPESVFDVNDFLKNIIILHLKNKKIDLKLLEEITEMPKTLKEKALLKTLILEYI